MHRDIIFELAEKIDIIAEALSTKNGIRASRSAVAKICGIQKTSLNSACADGKISKEMQDLLSKAGNFSAEHPSWIDKSIPLKQRHLHNINLERRDTAQLFRHYLFKCMNIVMASEIVFQTAPGDAPLARIANLSVAPPTPLKGNNIVSSDEGRRQAISISLKPTFSTLRNEEIIDENDTVIALVDIEALYVFIVLDTSDKNMDLLDGAGVNGQEDLDDISITCRYLADQNGRIHFELSAGYELVTLAGTAPTLNDFISLEGHFTRDDWIGIGIDKGALQIVRCEFDNDENTVAQQSLGVKSQIKRQILNRGLQLSEKSGPDLKTRLTVKKYFMSRIFDDEDIA